MTKRLFSILLASFWLCAGTALAATTASVSVTLLVEEVHELVLVGPDSFSIYTHKAGNDMTGTTQSGSLVYTSNALAGEDINVTSDATIVTGGDGTNADGTFTVTAAAPSCVATGGTDGTPATVTITDGMAPTPLISNLQGVFQCSTALTYTYTVPIIDGPQETTYVVTYTLEP